MAERTRRAEEVAALIEAEIDSTNAVVGTLIGAEPDLCEQYSISRGVFREAARLLEHYKVAETREGRGGGLFVAQPDVKTVARGAARLLRRMRAEPNDLAEARLFVEVACVRLATERATAEEIEELRQFAAENIKGGHDAFHSRAVQFHVRVARLSRNPALILFSEILAIITEQRVSGRAYRNKEAAEIDTAHREIVEAIATGDPQLAEERVRGHFAQMIASWGKRESFTGLNSASFG